MSKPLFISKEIHCIKPENTKQRVSEAWATARAVGVIDPPMTVRVG
jgi:hypothetical protein